MSHDILLATPLPASTEEALARRFACHRLPRNGALPAPSAGRIRAIATVNRADAALIESLPALELIASCTVGVDGIDLDAARRHGIRVTNTPDVLTDCVAETALALTLNVVHRFPAAERWLRAGDWERHGAFPLASELRGRTMGILGLGRIGSAIAQRALAFGMRIRYHNRRPQDCAWPYDPDPLALASNSDLLMVATPGGAATHSLVNAAVLQALGPEGWVVNIARGSVIDEDALIDALREKRICGAGLDVFRSEPHVDPRLLALDNVVLLPHTGSASVETRAAMAELMIENLRRHFAGEPLLTPIS